MSNLVKVKGLNKQFGQLKALDNISLEIKSGESLGLVGESGSGKTTLSRLILRLIEPSSGEIVFDGINNIRKDCQIVFQDPQTSLNPRIRVGAAIEEPVKIHKNTEHRAQSTEHRVRELLEMVKLPVEFANR